ncbi:MAG: hypothetical protein RL757_2287 [Bacteroidota bacterium]|jgi:hypothetical protein
MDLSKEIAKHFKAVEKGGNWTSVCFKEQLSDLNWTEATTVVYEFNTIAELVFHVYYFVGGLIEMLETEQLTIKDKYSFDCPPIVCEQDWQNLLSKTTAMGEKFAHLVENLPTSILSEDFYEKKYGNYYRNLVGVTEHMHYHLGQIVLIKKIIRHQKE